MTASLRRSARAAGLIAAITLVVIGAFAPRVAAAGWLIAFASVGAIVFGTVALLLIHALTGGRWGVLARPVLTAAAALAPMLLFFFLALLVGAAAVYPWVRDPSSAGPGVAELYLNLGFFAGRGLIFIAGVALFATLARSSRLGQLAAGIGLIWYCVGMDLLAVDWLSSIEPGYTSSAFGAQIIVEQLIAALAWVILATGADADDESWVDLGSLLLATTLGETYLILMTFIVQWYGDQPHEAAWYLRRTEHGWMWIELIGPLVGSFGPMIALLFARVRRSKALLRIVALASLVGVVAENIWLVSPAAGAWSAPAGLLAIVAAAGLAIGFADLFARIGRERRSASHGV